MKRLMSAVCAVLALCLGLAACNTGSSSGGGSSAPSSSRAPAIAYTETIRVYNASEYIDQTTLADFEREFAIKVEYEEFESNEAMYSEIIASPNSYDVLVPSDYLADRLIKEGRLAPLDKSKLSTLGNIAGEYLSPSYDPGNSYTVPYMVGTLGLLYNKRQVADEIKSWEALFDSRYSGKVLMLNSQRDTIGLTLKMLGYSMNSGSDTELEQAKARLQAARVIVAAYNESEEIRDKLVAGEGTLGVVYSGDAKTAIDRNPNLAYIIPEEGSNKWVDSFVIMKDSQHIDAAHKFIEFMCRSNIAVRNMSDIGYTSPVQGAWSEFNSNKIMFPSAEELERCEAFLYDENAAGKYSAVWGSVR